MQTYLDVEVPEELCRHLFLSFVRRPNLPPQPSSAPTSYTFPFSKPKSQSISSADHNLVHKDLVWIPNSAAQNHRPSQGSVNIDLHSSLNSFDRSPNPGNHQPLSKDKIIVLVSLIG